MGCNVKNAAYCRFKLKSVAEIHAHVLSMRFYAHKYKIYTMTAMKEREKKIKTFMKTYE